MAGDVAVHIGPRRDKNVVANRNPADNGGVCADPYAISQGGRTPPLAAVFLANRHSLMQVAVRSDDDGLVNRDVKGVAEVEPGSDLRVAANFQAVPHAHSTHH